MSRGGVIGEALRWANDALAFLLELVALAYWGARVGPGTPAKVALAVGAPLLAAIVWGLFAAPRARFAVPLVGVLVVKALVFGAAVAALATTGHRALAVAFAVVVVANTTVATLVRNRAKSAQRSVSFLRLANTCDQLASECSRSSSLAALVWLMLSSVSLPRGVSSRVTVW